MVGYRNRQSIRLEGYDYNRSGVYFLTICSNRRKPKFGSITNGQVLLSVVGRIVEEEWHRTARLRPEVRLDEYVIMPNHMHAIIHVEESKKSIDPVGAHRDAPLRRAPLSLGSVVAGFKGSVTRRVRRVTETDMDVWQRNYYDRIIRNDDELKRLRQYIANNPQKWQLDQYFTESSM